MSLSALFLNDAGRLRSGWRLALFVCAFVAFFILFEIVAYIPFAERLANVEAHPYWFQMVSRAAFLGAAVFAGWLCNYWLEGLPWRALGLSLHSGWWRDLLVGSLIGAMSLTLAALIAVVAGRLRFTLDEKEMLLPVARALAGTAALFIVAALAEEALCRGYPMQTFIRAHLIGFGILISALPFASLHFQNPSFNVLAFINAALAGVLFAIAYLRTRSLWFPLGIHWAWNWFQGSILGGAVSGLTITSHPVMHSIDKGPVWLTGGSYGLEGGICCTFALLISTLVVWRTGLVSATPELKQLTSDENPARPRGLTTLSGEL